ncbi:hypothetical protein [Romboutsia sp.]|uniref:hypothetical protein n=1 Tax=Romboutsia sp. TaxID=1965302 RepID=UPI003F301EF4
MENKKMELIEPLLNRGKVFRLKCEKCKSVSVEISEKEKSEYTCFECGGKCKIF